MFRLLLPILVTVSTSRTSVDATEDDLCDRDISIDISNGSLISGKIIHNNITYDEGEFYQDNETSTRLGCVCLKRTCVRKCCPFGFAYEPKKRQCLPWDIPFDPPLWDEYNNRLEGVHATNETINFVFGLISCEKWDGSFRFMATRFTEEFHLRTDGRLFVELEEGPVPFTLRAPDKYCLDTFVAEGRGRLDALVCFMPDVDNHNYVLSSVCMLVSSLFLLATLLVYGCLPELRNMHGRVLMGYLVCLLVGFICMAAVQVLLLVQANYRSICMVMTFIVYFFLLSSFFWLNVMSFDIWWTFSGKRGLSLEKLSTRGRFLAYCAYAFGLPTTLTALLALVEFFVPRSRFTPQIRLNGTCFLDSKARLIYFYVPILGLCISNTLFFILTAIRIAAVNKQTAVLKSNESARHDSHRGDKQRLVLYIKIFTVMGVSWILEVASAIWPNWTILWNATDTYNVLMGVMIFVIFVCKRKIFRLIKKRFKGEPCEMSDSMKDIEMTTKPSLAPRGSSIDTVKSILSVDSTVKDTKLCGQWRGQPAISRTQTATSRTLSTRDELHANSIRRSN